MDQAPNEALTAIRTLAAAGRFVAQVHCEDRMRCRGLRHDDLRHGLANATSIRRSDADHRSEWTVIGPDARGEVFIVAIVFDAAPPGWIEAVTVHDADGNRREWFRR